MSSDKGKGVAAGTRRKTRAPMNSVTLKQKTLLDSFFVKTSPKESPQAAEDLTRTVDTQTTTEVVQHEQLESDAPSIQLGVALVPKPEVILVDEIQEPQPKTELPLTQSIVTQSIAVEDNLTAIDDNRQDQDVQSHRRRSPSIVIIDDELPNTLATSTTASWASDTGFKAPFMQEGKTPDLPIVIIESSPIKAPSASSKSNRPIHPFFGAKKALTSSLPFPRRTPVTQQTSQLPSYPDRNSQHVRGLQTAISGHLPMFPTRISDSSKQVAEPHNYEFLKKGSISQESTQNPTYLMSNSINGSILSNIPQEHKNSHPAIARVLDYSPEDPLESRRPWSDKWRPTCAQEVLGNEKSALYLRNWLQALELQLEDTSGPSNDHGQPADEVQSKLKVAKRGLKRARVVRTVDKKRKKSRIDSDEEDDWIVQTEDEWEDDDVTYEAVDDFDELRFEPPTSSPSSSCPDLPPFVLQEPPKVKEPDLGQLHNTILLVGPHGVGKTASVYACAEELGWDVFEVYPGIGRRNGAHVDNLIGEVGKNHLVLQNRQPGDALNSFLRKKSQPESSKSSAEDLRSGYSPRKPSTFKAASEDDEPTKSTTKTVRQSLILLEEVDILYKEDSNFWSAVIRIIKECKRPVICTCNDISLVPLEDLPLQSILYFEPCHSSIAVSYLQGLCAAEGRPVERELVSGLYTLEQASNSFSAEHIPKWDLRRNINAMQVLSTTANSIEETRSRLSGNISEANGTFVTSAQGKLHMSVKGSEMLSYLDGILDLDSSTIAEFAGYLPSEDDEMGYAILHDLHAQDAAQFGQDDRHEDILTTASRLCREMFDVGDALTTQAFEENGESVRSEHRRVLQEVCPTAVWTRRDAGVALDYIPLIRQMVAADDEQEAREAEKKRGGGRSTRNSGRSGYVRMIGMTEDGRRVLETCGLVVAW